jgi:hypothetical protein
MGVADIRPCVAVAASSAGLVDREIPKSPIFTTPSASTKQFDGLTSRCS